MQIAGAGAPAIAPGGGEELADSVEPHMREDLHVQGSSMNFELDSQIFVPAIITEKFPARLDLQLLPCISIAEPDQFHRTPAG